MSEEPADERQPDATQPALPFEDGPVRAADAPIPYELTVRARRSVAPATLPELSVVPATRPPLGDDGVDGEPDPFDTRPARARALRRAGLSVRAVAQRLRVGDELAGAWCRDVRPVVRRRSGRRGVAAVPAQAGTGPVGEPSPAVDPETPDAEPPGTVEPEAVAGAGAAAVAALTAAPDVRTVGGAALVAALATVTGHAVTVTTEDPGVARTALRWLEDHAGVDRARIRVRLQAAPRVARDLTVHRWADALGLPADRVAHAPWPAAPHDHAVRVTLRLTDPAVAATVAGWRAAVLEILAAEPAPSDAC